MKLTKLALMGTIAAVFALMIAPSAMAAVYTGTIACVSGCSSANTIALSGPGSSGSANFILYGSNAPAATTFEYFVCPSGASSCASASGTDNGWSWSFTPTSGTTAACTYNSVAGQCEGDGYGSPSTLTLSLTAPTIVTPSNAVETLIIYACSQVGTSVNCNSAYTEVASLTIAATVPQFAVAGTGFAVVLGVVGLLFLRKRSLPSAAPAAV